MSERATGYDLRFASLRFPRASAMELPVFFKPGSSSSLGMALVATSSTPLVLLDESLVVQAASRSFCRTFLLEPDAVVGAELFSLGDGEWDVPQLRSLLTATASGRAEIDAYEMDLKRAGQADRCLVVNAHVLEQGDEALRLVMAVTDVTEARQAVRDKDALASEKHVLIQELNHRVANSLQIIASVLMQRVRSVQSEETRAHLRDAHHRVMSVATLQRQLAFTASGDVALRAYFTDLCTSIGASMILDHALLTITVEADDSTTTADRSVSMGLIVTELVINALKHAFPDPAARGAVTIRFNAAAGAGWVLSVADDGVGIAAEHAVAMPGLGTGIVNALAAQLGAAVEVSDGHPGMLVSIIHGSD